MNTYLLLDQDGFTLAEDKQVTIAQGKKTAKRDLAPTSEYTDAYKAEIRNKHGFVIWDAFRPEKKTSGIVQ